MKRHFALSHHYAAASNNDNSPRQGSTSASTATPSSMMYTQLYQQPPSGMQHPAFSRASDSPHRFDPRSVPMISPLQRPHIPSAGASMHISPMQPGSFPPRRVSLLRDIGRAGERDRDLPTSGSSMFDSHGGVGVYPANASVRHVSNSSQIISGIPHTYDRSITLLSNMPHYQQQQQHLQVNKDQSSSSHIPPSHPVPHGGSSAPLADVKKEPGIAIKQEVEMKPSPIQPSNPSMASQVPAMGAGAQCQQNIPSVQPVCAIEQKSKEDLVQAMDKVDRELSKVELEINRLEKRKTQLEESAKKPPEPEKEEASPQRAEPKHRDLWQVIYADNRKKAEEAREGLDKICPIYDMPLYNQPSDTKVFQDNLKKNEEMRPKLLKYFQRRRKLENIREKYLSVRYDQLMEKWQRKTERTENNIKKKAKDAKTREFFEKLFPEVRKLREQQERVDRVGTRGDACRSDADFAEIVDGLSEQENQLRHMRQHAVVPPMLMDREERRVTFVNNNGFMSEPFKEFKESQQLDTWADHEKAIFKEKYVQHPKNFNLIASCIEKKSVADCILYYYLTKKANNYKALVRKQSMKPRKPKSGRAQAHHHDQSAAAKDSDKIDKDEIKKEVDCEPEDTKVDKPPSPRMTRARKQTMNWTEQEINLVKEGFSKYGKDFSSIARMVANKSEQQVKNFYHNYKKKHGLDQLIAERKPKKGTRTRHPAPSPDVTPSVDDDTNSRKSNESPLSENKVKVEKEKTEDSLPSEDKKKTKESTTSSAVSSSGSAAETVDSSSLSTPHIRTRRTTAALAAAASHDAQTTESGKRHAGDKSAPSSGEPVEKKPKKTERRSRTQKTSESAKDPVKTEPSKEEVISAVLKTSGASKENSDPPESGKEAGAAAKADPPAEGERKKAEDKKETEKPSSEEKIDAESSTSKPDPTKSAVLSKKPLLDDHDSSATCSADEETPPDVVASSVQSKIKPVDSPYGFDDDFNDAPASIRLERARATTKGSLPSKVTTTINAQQPANSQALNLATKPSVVVNDGRPQSLPPGSMVPSQTVPSKPVSTGMPLVVPGIDMSRPNSTPVFGGFSASSKLPPSPYLTPSFHGQEQKPTNTSIPKPVVMSSPVIVKSIGDLTYDEGMAAKKSAPTPVKASPAVVDLTKDNSSSRHHLAASTSYPERKVEVGSSPVTSLSRHQYHPTHPTAASLQKDFTASSSSAAAASGTPSLPPPSYPRVYTEKDKQAMKERAANIPDSPIPVANLRFMSADAKAPVFSPQQFKSEPLMGPNEQVLAGRANGRKAHVKDVKAGPPPSMPPSHLPPHSFSPRTVNPKVMGPPHARMSSVSSTASNFHRAAVYSDKPTQFSSSMAPTSVTMGIKASSPDKIVPGHVVISGGSITQGKPVFRAQLAQTPDPRDAEKEKQKQPPPMSSKEPVSQGKSNPSMIMVSSQSLPLESPARRISQHGADAIPGPRGGYLPTLPTTGGAIYGLRLPSGAVMPPVKIERPSDPHPILNPYSSEDFRTNINASIASQVSMRLNPQQLQNLSVLPGMPHIPSSIVQSGGIMKAKALEEANISPRSISQRSMTPPQISAPDRKVSHVIQSSSGVGSELTSKRSSPAILHTLDKHLKEDAKRPSSASRATPEQAAFMGASEMFSDLRSSSSHPHLPSSKLRNPLHPDSKLPDDLHGSQASTTLAEQRLINAVVASHMNMPNPYLTPGFPPLQHAHDPAALIIQQYLQQQQLASAGFPYPVSAFPPGGAALMRSFSPSTNDSLENSRNSVINHDYLTAQQMQQQSIPLIAQSVGVGASLPTGAGLPGQPVSATTPNPLIPPRHSGSPATMERLNFIPQHVTISSPLSTHSSPRSSMNQNRTPNPQSPSSPHASMKPHAPPSSMGQFLDSHTQATADRRKSSSPLRLPSTDRRTPTSYSMMMQDGRQPSPMLYPSSSSRHSSMDKTPISLPEGHGTFTDPSMLLAMQSNSPQLARQSASPLTAYKNSRAKEQEKSLEQQEIENQRKMSLAERHYAPSPERAAHVFASEAARNQLIEAQMMQGRHAFDNAQRTSRGSGSNPNLASAQEQRSNPSRDKMPEHVPYSSHAQDKTARDLKTMGRASMTPNILIHAIIDHKINQYEDAAMQDKQAKQRATPSGQHGEVPMISDTKPKVVGQIDPKFVGMGQKAPSSGNISPLPHDLPRQGSPFPRTKTLHEHSHDVIANMYKKDSPKPEPSRNIVDAKKPEDATSMVPSKFPPLPSNYPPMPNEDALKQAKSTSRSAMFVHPFTPAAINQQDLSLESVILHALLSDSQASAPSGSPIPKFPTSQQARSDPGSGHSSPSSRAPVAPFPSERNPAVPFRSNPPELKRTEPLHFGVAPTPVTAAAPQPMFSALSFRAGQTSNTAQQVPPPPNVPGRPVPSGSGTQAPRAISSTGTFHPQAPPAPVERTPLPTNQYEPLSDSD